MNYLELKSQQPEMKGCFFAFSDKQLKEGMQRIGVSDTKSLRSAGQGLYGTLEGLRELNRFYDEITDRIGKECDPQQVYNCEYDNHECGYINDDYEAIKICLAYFGEERTKEIKRRNAFVSLSAIEF